MTGLDLYYLILAIGGGSLALLALGVGVYLWLDGRAARRDLERLNRTLTRLR